MATTANRTPPFHLCLDRAQAISKQTSTELRFPRQSSLPTLAPHRRAVPSHYSNAVTVQRRDALTARRLSGRSGPPQSVPARPRYSPCLPRPARIQIKGSLRRLMRHKSRHSEGSDIAAKVSLRSESVAHARP